MAGVILISSLLPIFLVIICDCFLKSRHIVLLGALCAFFREILKSQPDKNSFYEIVSHPKFYYQFKDPTSSYSSNTSSSDSSRPIRKSSVFYYRFKDPTSSSYVYSVIPLVPVRKSSVFYYRFKDPTSSSYVYSVIPLVPVRKSSVFYYRFKDPTNSSSTASSRSIRKLFVFYYRFKDPTNSSSTASSRPTRKLFVFYYRFKDPTRSYSISVIPSALSSKSLVFYCRFKDSKTSSYVYGITPIVPARKSSVFYHRFRDPTILMEKYQDTLVYLKPSHIDHHKIPSVNIRHYFKFKDPTVKVSKYDPVAYNNRHYFKFKDPTSCRLGSNYWQYPYYQFKGPPLSSILNSHDHHHSHELPPLNLSW